MQDLLITYKQEVKTELNTILTFWAEHSLDQANGGFIGKMNNAGLVYPDAEKGCVLNARILWAFSAAFNACRQADPEGVKKNLSAEWLLIAARAYHYLHTYFRDSTHGGVYWSVNKEGQPLKTRKQIYALAFTIYGLSEYYLATQQPEAIKWAIQLFELIEKYSFDPIKDGYFEAFSEDWHLLQEVRLSEKDRNDPKTTNTHLHLIEAYVNLYKVYKSERIEAKIRHLLEVFEKQIIDPETHHMKLFFDADWCSQSSAISYGHDVEASWLLHEAAETLNDADLSKKWRKIAVRMANATQEGFNADGSLNHEYDPDTRHLDKHREWWVSAEGMVGYLNAFQISQNPVYLKRAFGLWNFTKKHLIDHKNGEWFWGVYDDKSLMQNEDKIGFWKCPYHNARACMEILKR